MKFNFEKVNFSHLLNDSKFDGMTAMVMLAKGIGLLSPLIDCQ